MSRLGPSTDYAAARRRAILAQVRAAIASRQHDPAALMTLDDVVAALGFTSVSGSRRTEVPAEAIIGTMARRDEFDREFRPRTTRVRDRWLRVAGAVEAGEVLPPVELTRVGDMYFVRDGHHRVAVAKALGHPVVDAHVRRLCTVAFGMLCLQLKHLPSKAAERLFLERVPLPDDVRTKLWLDDPADWMRLADSAEAWGFRSGMTAATERERRVFAEAWWTGEVLPSLAAHPDVQCQYEVQRYVTLLHRRQRTPARPSNPAR
ncbi:hypothetical protein [Amycolatopsis taiwanensis]|uniref:Chromosome partitioning protein ParB n=1 Tax=Amycolatopsis taiwanensis TaxID=342230 RepID=A0A9W6QWX1_9PSEU|nr:hypothetical protein [Amycolatopsis taiwanensis]GLY65539.1 hypothetical protein Atai01_21580 [Amycolatopsis taiwanensis]